MKVIKRQPDIYEAYQWTGNSYEDFLKFKVNTNLEYTVCNAIYIKEDNTIQLEYDDPYNGAIISYNQFLVYSNEGIEILNEKQFTEKYTEVKG